MNKRGKITLSVIIVLILLVSFSLYSILGVPDNVKNYDAETKTVTINIGATEVAKLKLNFSRFSISSNLNSNSWSASPKKPFRIVW